MSTDQARSLMLHAELTDAIIKGYYHVYNRLGHGFLEKVYENAMAVTLMNAGLSVARQVQLKVYFEGVCVGEYFADLIVGGKVIVEIKAAEALCPAHEAQLLNYLKATEIEVGLLFNFGAKADFRRKLFTNDRKSLPNNLGSDPCKSVASVPSVVHSSPPLLPKLAPCSAGPT